MRTDDDRVRAAFEALRSEDSVRLVPLDALLSRRHHRPPARIARRAIVAAAAVAVLAFAIARVTPRAHPDVPVAEIVAWRAPSDVLLAGYGDSLGDITPLGRSALDPFLSSPTATGANR
jgi:hypothetical protein